MRLIQTVAGRLSLANLILVICTGKMMPFAPQTLWNGDWYGKTIDRMV